PAALLAHPRKERFMKSMRYVLALAGITACGAALAQQTTPVDPASPSYSSMPPAAVVTVPDSSSVVVTPAPEVIVVQPYQSVPMLIEPCSPSDGLAPAPDVG